MTAGRAVASCFFGIALVPINLHVSVKVFLLLLARFLSCCWKSKVERGGASVNTASIFRRRRRCNGFRRRRRTKLVLLVFFHRQDVPNHVQWRRNVIVLNYFYDFSMPKCRQKWGSPPFLPPLSFPPKKNCSREFFSGENFFLRPFFATFCAFRQCPAGNFPSGLPQKPKRRRPILVLPRLRF